MPRSQAQSDFSIDRSIDRAIDRASEVRLPAIAVPVALPRAEVFASELATRWILRLTFLLLAVFAVLCAVGPHIPGGE